MKNKISAVITAFNEEKKLAECLESVSFVDEIIVIDSSSTDKTPSIAKQYTKHVYKKENNLMLNVNKNFGFTKATGDWILSLDADERVTPELKNEILSTLNFQLSTPNGYWTPRKNIIFGKWIQHAGWYPDYQLRLFRNGKGSFPQKHVHEMIEVSGQTEKLQNHLLHYNYDTISQFIQKLDGIYANNEAEQLLKNGYSFSWADAIRMPAKEFLSRFFARQGYKDGFHGLMLSFLMAFYHFVVFAKIWEKKGFREIQNDTFLQEVEHEFKKNKTEFRYWFKHENMKNARSLAHRIWLKISS